MKKLFYLFMVAMCATMFSACSDDDDKDPLDDEEGKEGVITMVCEDDRIDLDAATLKEGEIITIDWGDGNVEEFKSVRIYGWWDGQWYEGDDEYFDFESEIHYVIGNGDEYDNYDKYSIYHEYSNSNPHIVTIKGEIKMLYCFDNELTSLDVSKCTALTFLNCSDNNLTSLDVSKNTALAKLWCANNELTSLDVRGCTALTELYCFDNELTSLDVSKCTALTFLNCDNNKLSSAALNQIFRDLPQGKKLEDYPYQSTICIDGNPGTNTCDKSIAENKGWDVYNR